MKKSIKALVIDSDQSMTGDIMKYFSGHEVIDVVACKKDGEEALDYIINNPKIVDVIIMDIILPKCDGLFILNELKRRNINKSIIVMSSFKDDTIVKEVSNLGASFYMLKPINLSSLEKRITSLNFDKKSDAKFNLQAVISDLLHNLGVPSHVRGYLYIRDGITLLYENKGITYITKDIYPVLAEKYETTTSRVERAIRHAIEISWTRGDLNMMTDIFGNSLDLDRDKPTNSEYLTTLADRIRLNNDLVCN